MLLALLVRVTLVRAMKVLAMTHHNKSLYKKALEAAQGDNEKALEASHSPLERKYLEPLTPCFVNHPRLSARANLS